MSYFKVMLVRRPQSAIFKPIILKKDKQIQVGFQCYVCVSTAIGDFEADHLDKTQAHLGLISKLCWCVVSKQGFSGRPHKQIQVGFQGYVGASKANKGFQADHPDSTLPNLGRISRLRWRVESNRQSSSRPSR